MRHIDFTKDPLKHYVRKYGWLEASKRQREEIGDRLKEIPLRYFTFCAADAIDVFMLLREGILTRSHETGRLEEVYFCERNPANFGKIASLIGSPEQGFQGEFQEIVLFEDDEDTKGIEYGDDIPYSPGLWEKLSRKDANRRLREAFPFDIINLDVCGVTFPFRPGVMKPLMDAIFQILEWQTVSKFSIKQHQFLCDRFTLFLTSHIDADRTNQLAIQLLESQVVNNIKTYLDFESAFVEKYGHKKVNQLIKRKFPEFFCVAFPKYIIQRALSEFGWKVTSGPTFLYKRFYPKGEKKEYQIMHTVSVYERIPESQLRDDATKTSEYIQSVTQLVNDGAEWVDDIVKHPNVSLELAEDLKQIVELRDRRRNS